MTRSDTRPACRAARARVAIGLRPTRLRNTGSVPGGSMMTIRVIVALMKSFASKTSAIAISALHDLEPRRARDQLFQLPGVGGALAERDRLVRAVVVAGAGDEQAELAGELAGPGPRRRVWVRGGGFDPGEPRRGPVGQGV